VPDSGTGRTDTTTLSLSLDVMNRAKRVHRRAMIETPYPMPVDWWTSELIAQGFPLPDGMPSSLRRIDVFRYAEGASQDPERALTLLWYALAWGSGKALRQNRRRIESVGADRSAIVEHLARAAGLAAVSPFRAFEVLFPGGRSLIKSLGPAFATKFLYFAGGGAADHPSLILDSVVATVLKNDCGWRSLATSGGWPADTYERYCQLCARWAEDLEVAPDQVEFALWHRDDRPPSS